MNEALQKFKLRGIKLPTEMPKYKILSIEDGIIENEINEIVKNTMEVLEKISTEDCQKLLYDFNWDSTVLMDKFTEADSFDDFLQKNKIDLSIPLTSETMINSYVLSNSLLKKCPRKSNSCNKIAKIQSSDVTDIRCECGYTYCFKCKNIPHSPFPCILISEWVKQCDSYDLIVENNNTICPSCSEVFAVDFHGYITCTNCQHVFRSYDSLIEKPWVFKDYKYSLDLSERLETIFRFRDTLKICCNTEFATILTDITQSFLERVLPLPLYWFFLDKEYLSKNSSLTTNFVPMFEYSQDDLETNLMKLMKVIDEKGSQFLTFENAWISDEEQNDIMDILHNVQKHLDKISKFIEETDGWIFKIPEIQEAFDEKNKKFESKSEERYDVEMDCESECDDSDENDMNDDEESGDAEVESSENDEMKDSFVFV